MNTKGPTRSKIRTTIEHEIPLSPVVPVTVWSEQNAIKPIHVYDTHQNTLLNGTSKHSKINQMGPPMLFSDLESDSSSTESVSNIYQIVSPDTAVKPVLKQYIQTHPYTVQPRVVHSTVEIQDDSYDPAQHLQPNGLVTLLNPNDPDGPTVTDQGPVYLYATRVKHNDHKSHYSD
ncbi:unnamed protein product [Echinostoma caproni]|uniref:CP2 domain-containing protein n=1 Tax=Echinostoma caproni TaxID=27848 RepID=A0A183A8X7_9TREM|nr:unnamed protein product [Echinostoma caproni]